ncbi:MAG: CoA transferase [Myxococcota bacterium]
MSEAILSGIRVVDLSSGVSGQVAGLLLAESGADVIKVEPPGGDALRVSAGYRTWNRSKRGVVLDLHDESDLGRLDDLLATSDVLLHSLRPAAAARRGLDDTSLSSRHPQLVFCSVLGYPVGHADAERPGYDILVQARMGLMDEQLGVRDGPIFLRFPIPTWNAVWLAACGVLARLQARERDGRGGPVHTSLIQGALAPMMQYWARAEKPLPAFAWGLPKNMMSGLYECGDGRWIHMMGRPEQVSEIPLMRETLADLSEAEVERARRDIAHLAAPPNAVQDPARMVAAFRRCPADEWLAVLWASDAAVMPSDPPGRIFSDEQARACGYLADVDDPVLGPVTMAGIPYEVDPPGRVQRPAPTLGEHDAEVFAEVREVEARQGTKSEARGTGRPPFEGLRVLDFGNFLAGPFSPMLLSDLGADVIKLEATTGDMMRPVSRSFCGCQRGKRGIAVDLKHPDSRAIVEALVKDIDVVHHNLRYPAARKLGIDYESLRALNPRLIYCHTSSYGPRGPRADWPGYDQLFQACSGWEVASGGPGNPPIWHRMGTMDHQNAFASLYAVLLALRERERSGRGQFVRTSILGAAVLTASELHRGAGGELPAFPEVDPAQTGISPGYRIFEVEGGWIAVAALAPESFAALLGVAGVEEAEALPGALRVREREELLRALEAANVPAEAVRTGQENGFFERSEHRDAGLAVSYPQSEMGRMEQVGALWNFVNLPLCLDVAPPALGEHTAEILAELGHDKEQITDWVERGVVAIDARHTRR